jgi:hypothetical protein
MTGRASSLWTIGALAAVGVIMLYPIDDFDVWWLLRSGAYMVETRSFPTTDPFSGPAFGAEWINHAWGFQLLLYGAYRVGGIAGMIVLQALFAVATFGVLYGILRRERIGQGLALAVILVAGLATRGFWSPRPQVATYLALAIVWAILRASRDGTPDRLLWLPVLTAVWANFHGGFMVGPTLIGLVFAGEVVERALGRPTPVRLGRLAGAGGLCLLAMFATPFHYHAVLFPLDVLADRYAQGFLIEWASPAFHVGQVRLIEGLVLLALITLWLARRRPVASDILVLAAFFHFSVQAVRNLPLLVVVLVPVLAKALSEAVTERAPELAALMGWSRQRVLTAVAAAGIAMAVWWNYPSGGAPDLVPRIGVVDIFPAGAADYLKRARPPGPLFNEYGWGGYLIWRLYPDYRVGIDGRMAVHGNQRFSDYMRIADLHPGWRETLGRMGFRLAVMRTRSPLVLVLRESPDWEILFEDKIAVVLAKKRDTS